MRRRPLFNAFQPDILRHTGDATVRLPCIMNSESLFLLTALARVTGSLFTVPASPSCGYCGMSSAKTISRRMGGRRRVERSSSKLTTKEAGCITHPLCFGDFYQDNIHRRIFHPSIHPKTYPYQSKFFALPRFSSGIQNQQQGPYQGVTRG